MLRLGLLLAFAALEQLLGAAAHLSRERERPAAAATVPSAPDATAAKLPEASSHREAELRVEGRTAREAALEREVRALRSRIEDLTADKKELVSAVRAVMHTNRTADLEHEVELLRLRGVAEASRSKRERDSLADQLQRERAATAEARSAAERVRNEEKTLLEQARTQGQEAKRLRSQLTDAEDRLSAAEKDSVRAAAEAREKMRIAAVASDRKAAEEQLKLRASLVSETKKVEEVTASARELRERGLGFLHENEELKRSLAGDKSKLKSLTQDKAQMLKTLQGLLRENSAYKARLNASEARARRLAASEAEAEKRLASAEAVRSRRGRRAATPAARRGAPTRRAVPAKAFRGSAEKGKPLATSSQHAAAAALPASRVKPATIDRDELQVMGGLARIDAFIARARAR